MSRYSDYHGAIQSDVEDFTNDFFEDYIDEVVEGNTDFHDFLNDDGKLIESIDQSIDLRDAVEIIEQCENEEWDSGLWEGLPPKESVISMAFWSYKNDFEQEVRNEWYTKIDEMIMDKEVEVEELENELESLKEDYDNIEDIDDNEDEIDDLKNEIEELEEQFENLNDELTQLGDALDSLG